MYKCQKMSLEQAENIYNTRMLEDFPQNELKPFKSIRRGHEAGLYDCIGLYDNEEILGYAFFFSIKKNNEKIMLLDYFAIEKSHRHSGLGGNFLALLSDFLKTADLTIIESEDPTAAKNEEERQIQASRLDFYEKNGCEYTGIDAYVFGAEYKVLKLHPKRIFTREEIVAFYNDIYQSMLLPKYYNRNYFYVK